MAWAELEKDSNMTLLDGSNTGIAFLGPPFSGRLVRFEFLWVLVLWVDSVVDSWDMFAVAEWFIHVL